MGAAMSEGSSSHAGDHGVGDGDEDTLGGLD